MGRFHTQAGGRFRTQAGGDFTRMRGDFTRRRGDFTRGWGELAHRRDDVMPPYNTCYNDGATDLSAPITHVIIELLGGECVGNGCSSAGGEGYGAHR
eukprot:4224330-Pyramimonas_sp.AAC.1